MGAANMRSGVEALAKVIVGVGIIGALLFTSWIAYWIGWWVFSPFAS